MTGILFEVLADDARICMSSPAFHAISRQILTNLASGNHVHVESDTKLSACVRFGATSTVPEEVTDFMGDAQNIAYWNDLREDDRIVNVVRMIGPMTRNGGDCSYGSIQIRDKIMKAAELPQTKAHILYTRTPGGMASTLRDLRMAFNYARERGQKVYMYCDGDVASGGAFTAAMCDGVYAMNPDDTIGSLGMYSAFVTLKDGDVNTITQETYHEYYAEASRDKNLWYRDAAKGNLKTLAEETEADLARLLANLHADRPTIKEEHCTGKMYRMGDVLGSMIDGFCSMSELASLALEEWDQRKGAKVAVKPSLHEKTKSNQKTEDNMSKNYVSIPGMIGEESLVSGEDNLLCLQEYQADALEKAISEQKAQVESMTAELNELRANAETFETERTAHTEEVAGLNARIEELTANAAVSEENDNQIAALNAQIEEMTTARDTVNGELETERAHSAELQESLNTANASLETAQAETETARGEIETLNQRIADLNAEIETLQTNAAAIAQQSPANNGQSADAPRFESAPQVSDFNGDIKAYNKAMEAYNKVLESRIR